MLRNLKYMVMAQDQHAGRIHNIKIGNKFSEMTNILHMWDKSKKSDSIHEEIKRNFKSGVACYHSMKFFLLVFYLKI
jgi:hypothetical protein